VSIHLKRREQVCVIRASPIVEFEAYARDEVPEAVCRSGPYKFVRHPFYLSYVVAFLGVVAAFPSLATGCVCVLNIGLFLYLAFDDERVLLLSPLAADYRAYRMRAGMFLPRVGF
jgi:protein-S-isoprenylcysteine O-methyltransferase Ste14